ncbi:Lsr2 family protein [Microbacterium sp. NPDC008134]|uniref:histone-like nucleoid-structuring protein Lsr2 n=1 Tax=Microbacterium sp. NPDC008134 TaxID=3364183 RepID=UPI0036E43C04
MAKREITQLIDDVDGTEATTSIRFAVGGTNFEIDLNDANAEKFHEALKPWTDVARKAKKEGSSSARTSSKSTGRRDLAAIRKWASDNGHAVSERGRIPANVIEAYDAAH